MTTLFENQGLRTPLLPYYDFNLTMKKILTTQLAVFFVLPFLVYADTASSSVKDIRSEIKEVLATTTSATTTVTSEENFTLCQQQAIEKRDTSLASSRLLYNTAMANALIDRKNREKAAIAIADKEAKKIAIRNSVDTYKNLVKEAQDHLVDARKNAWQTFEDEVESCREVKTEDVASSTENTAHEGSTVGGIQTVINAIKSLFEK